MLTRAWYGLAVSCILTNSWTISVSGRQVSQNHTGNFRPVTESYTGYDILPADVNDAISHDDCAASCLDTDHCTGYIFHGNKSSCQLVSEYCGGSNVRPMEGRLYTKKGICPLSSDFHYIDVGVECELCVRVSNASSMSLSYDDARAACVADGGSLLHFEDLLITDFENLLKVSDSTDFGDSYWIGVNSLKSPGQLAWDQSNELLTETELSVIELYDRPSEDVPVCIYLSSYFQEFYASNCSSPRGYICLVDT